MRNALKIGDDLVVTTDNSGGFGEKEHDLVRVPDHVTAYFATRVALLEQWAADADPIAILIHNFSGPNSWKSYVSGVEEIFQEAACKLPSLSGSTETNMELMQSAVAVTIIGKQRTIQASNNLEWYAYGQPLVGNEVLENRDQIASLSAIKEALIDGCIQRIWPVGSQGILAEFRKLIGDSEITIQSDLDINISAGPATTVLIGVQVNNTLRAEEHFHGLLHKIEVQ